MMSVDSKENKIGSPNVDVVIEGRTIVLRPLSGNEINERYLSWLNDPEINQFLETRYKVQTVADIYSYINKLRASPGCEIFGVFSKKSDMHVGNVAVVQHNPNNQGIASYGIMMGERRALISGLGAEAEALIVEFLFRHPEIRKVKAGSHSTNYKSWQLIESLGFKREAVLREEAVLSSSKICNVYLYGILKKEWLEQKTKVPFLSYMKIIDKRKVVDII